MAKVKYALISPTFKRPDEVTEFLSSLESLDYPKEEFQIILGDGTPNDELRPLLQSYFKTLPLKVYYEEFLPVSDARNRAAELASAEYFIFLDSDCIMAKIYSECIYAKIYKLFEFCFIINSRTKGCYNFGFFFHLEIFML